MGLRPLTGAEEFRREYREHPQRTLVIELGKGGGPEFRPDRFLERGGATLIATDRQRQRGPVSVSGSFVQIDPPAQGYRGSADCPFVEPIPNRNIPIFDGLSRVATNRPSFLTITAGRFALSYLARFPQACQLSEFPFPSRDRLAFAAGGQVGPGRLLILADHSVFINDMLLQPDNDNFDLAFKAISWLTDNGKRDRVLLVEDGQIVSNFNVSLKEPPPPPLPSDGEVIQAVNKMLAELEKENFYNRRLLRQISPGRPPDLEAGQARFLRGLIVTVTLVLLALGWLLVRRSRFRSDAREPLLETEMKANVPIRSLSAREKE